jgi:hypothetical protein
MTYKIRIWHHSLILFGFALIFINSCKKDEVQIPVLSTSMVSNITGTTANGGGNITSDGGSTITVRGICWSTGTAPSITDNKTTNGKGVGSFKGTISGLIPVSMYYVRAYATNSAGTGYGMSISFTTIPVAVGESYQGGKVAYILEPGDSGYDANVLHGLIAAPADQSTGADWACYGATISGADGTAIGTGKQNTIDIIAACLRDGTAAKLCSDLVLGGYSDWYLPSKDELNMLYLNREAIGGFTNSDYWSSTEYDATFAWNQFFALGNQEYALKSTSCNVRAIRDF